MWRHLSVHDAKLDMWKGSYPAFLVMLNMISQRLVDSFVGALTAAVGLEVVGGGHLELYTSYFCKHFPES